MSKEHSELDDFLAAEDHVQLRKYASYLLQPDHDRTLILNAHLVAEHLLEGIISTALANPGVFLENADFRGKLDLARALGLIGEHEVACCSVLNAARNSIAHRLEALEEKWKIEMDRLAYGKGSGINWNENIQKDLNKTLRVLLSLISACWLGLRFRIHVRKFREENRPRWVELMTEKTMANLDVLGKEGRAAEEKLANEVDLQLAREVKAKSKKEISDDQSKGNKGS
jgi:hypothetical protein